MRLRFALAAVTLVLAVSPPARATGNADAGHALAQLWCSSCNVVDLAASSGSDRAGIGRIPYVTIRISRVRRLAHHLRTR